MTVNANQFQLRRPWTISETSQTTGQDKLVVTIMLEPKNHPIGMIGRLKTLISLPQAGLSIVRTISGSQEPGALLPEIRNVPHRSLAERIGILQKIAGKTRDAQFVPDVGAATDMQRRDIAVEDGCHHHGIMTSNQDILNPDGNFAHPDPSGMVHRTGDGRGHAHHR